MAYKGDRRTRIVASGLQWPHGLAFNGTGAILINENKGDRIMRVEPGGAARTVAKVDRPVGLVFGKRGELYVASPVAGKMSMVKPDGCMVTLLLGLEEPRDPAFDAAGNL